MSSWDNTYYEQVKVIPDVDLLAAYQRTSGEPDDLNAEVLLAEIKRRKLAI